MVGGNVLTSQRVTDVVLKAFNAAAASQVRMGMFYIAASRAVAGWASGCCSGCQNSC